MFARLGRAVLGVGGCEEETSAVQLKAEPLLGCPRACGLGCRRSRAAPPFPGCCRETDAEDHKPGGRGGSGGTSCSPRTRHGYAAAKPRAGRIRTRGHPNLSHLHLEHRTLLLPTLIQKEPFPCPQSTQHPGKDLLSLQAGRNPPCPSKAFSSPNIIFIFPSPLFFILNKNIITGF